MLLNNVQELKDLLENDLVLVDFFATWCGPCKMLAPIVEKYASEHPEIKVAKVDVDNPNFQSVCEQLQIRSIPTLYIFKQGKAVAVKLGFMDQKTLENFVESNK